MLAEFADPTQPPGSVGDRWFLYVGPAVIFLALVFWVTLTLTASRLRPRGRHPRSGMPDRGPVQGGIISGSPSQRSRRDPAPSETYREVMAHIEQGRLEEEAVRERERQEARETQAELLGRTPARTSRKPRKRRSLFSRLKPGRPRSPN